jgi:hypothetical protein
MLIRPVAAAVLAASALLAVGACTPYAPGPAGRVTDKRQAWQPATKTFRRSLTVRTPDGRTVRFRVGGADYRDCYRARRTPPAPPADHPISRGPPLRLQATGGPHPITTPKEGSPMSVSSSPRSDAAPPRERTDPRMPIRKPATRPRPEAARTMRAVLGI